MKTFKEFITESTEFVEVNGVRVIKDLTFNATIFYYDEIERTDGSGRYRKGTPLRTEIERFQEDYDLDITNLKKSDFPLMYKYKTKETVKVKTTQTDNDSFDVVIIPKSPKDSVALYIHTDGIFVFIHKDDVEKYEKLDWKAQNAIFKVTGFGEGN